MTATIRRLSFLGDASPDDIVVMIAQAGGKPMARVLMPVAEGIERSLEYFSLEQAAARARAAAAKYGMAAVATGMGRLVRMSPFSADPTDAVSCFGRPAS
jgi:hypothetical protein